MDIPVLFEDNHLLIVEKPANLPVQADASKDADVLTLLKAYIKQAYNKPGEVYLGLVHRLDRPVGGVMVFARTSKAAKRLSEQLASRQTDKRYLAIVEGTPDPVARLDDYIKKDPDAIRALVQPVPFDGAKPASLQYRTIAKHGSTALLEVKLLTGRKHQIRAQLAAHDLPIMNDQRYNDRAVPGRQIALWAYSLTLTHPTRQIPLTFFAPPRGEAWSAYADILRAAPAFYAAIPVYADDAVVLVHKLAGITVAAADSLDAPAANQKTAPEAGSGTDVNTSDDALLPFMRGTVLEDILSNVYGRVYPVHRLDAGTEGLVVFARTEAAKAALEAAFLTHGIQKEYLAVLCGRLPLPADVLEMHLRKDADAARVSIQENPGRNTQPIKTGYRVLLERGGLSLAAVTLYTGRTHQIRAQMAYIGNPVLGDDLYGDRALNKLYRADHQLLTAYSMLFQFPENSPLAYLNGKQFTSPFPLELP